MKKKCLLLLLSALLVLSACSSKQAASDASQPAASQDENAPSADDQSDEAQPADTESENPQADETQAEDSTQDEASNESEEEVAISEEAAQALTALEPMSTVTVNKDASNVELTLPKELVNATTQKELDAVAEESGFESIILHEDGSATYTMSQEQHELMLTGIAEGIQEKLDELMDAGGYQSFKDLKVNSDFTEFTVTTASTELDAEESLSLVPFYMYGGLYNIFNGTPSANIHVDFINEASGEIIESADSSHADPLE